MQDPTFSSGISATLAPSPILDESRPGSHGRLRNKMKVEAIPASNIPTTLWEEGGEPFDLGKKLKAAQADRDASNKTVYDAEISQQSRKMKSNTKVDPNNNKKRVSDDEKGILPEFQQKEDQTKRRWWKSIFRRNARQASCSSEYSYQPERQSTLARQEFEVHQSINRKAAAYLQNRLANV